MRVFGRVFVLPESVSVEEDTKCVKILTGKSSDTDEHDSRLFRRLITSAESPESISFKEAARCSKKRAIYGTSMASTIIFAERSSDATSGDDGFFAEHFKLTRRQATEYSQSGEYCSIKDLS